MIQEQHVGYWKTTKTVTALSEKAAESKHENDIQIGQISSQYES
jgi:hypothetical protein